MEVFENGECCEHQSTFTEADMIMSLASVGEIVTVSEVQPQAEWTNLYNAGTFLHATS